jgi:hypothetical protein
MPYISTETLIIDTTTRIVDKSISSVGVFTSIVARALFKARPIKQRPLQSSIRVPFLLKDLNKRKAQAMQVKVDRAYTMDAMVTP